MGCQCFKTLFADQDWKTPLNALGLRSDETAVDPDPTAPQSAVQQQVAEKVEESLNSLSPRSPQPQPICGAKPWIKPLARKSMKVLPSRLAGEQFQQLWTNSAKLVLQCGSKQWSSAEQLVHFWNTHQINVFAAEAAPVVGAYLVAETHQNSQLAGHGKLLMAQVRAAGQSSKFEMELRTEDPFDLELFADYCKLVLRGASKEQDRV